MTSTASLAIPLDRRTQPLQYGGLIVMMLLSFLLVTAEFLPNGMLIEMASTLGITPGQAGQTVTVTALVGLLVAPTVGLIFPRLDRRSLLVWMAIAATVSNLVVAIAPNFAIILISRLLLGAAIASFWSMSITVAARLSSPDRLGRAVMFTTAGTSLATVAGVPVGVMLSELTDWRTVFVIVGIATGVLAIALRMLLPSVPAAAASSMRMLVDTLRRPGIGLGLAGHSVVVLGHFLAYTYVRLALERIPDVGAGVIVILLALFGVGGLAGNIVFGLMIDRRFGLLAVAVPLATAASVAAMVVLPTSIAGVGIVMVVWGALFSSWLIVVNAWVGYRMPDRLEAGGSLVVVGFQAAIMVAAGLGGLLVDAVGVEVAYILGAGLLVVGAVLFGRANRAVNRAAE